MSANTNTQNGHIKYFTSVKKAFSHKAPEQVLTLAPSILAANFADLTTDLKKMMRAKCYWAHLDVMDGHFVPNITFGPPAVKSIRGVSTRLFLDAHLMIAEPMKFLDPFADAGADLITFHAETVQDYMAKAVKAIRDKGVQPGLSIKPNTPVSLIEPVLADLDLVLVMTVEPGFGGQGLISNTLNKVRELNRIRAEKNLQFLIQVDGGINTKTAGLATAAGANVLVAGTAVFGTGGPAQNIQKLSQVAMERGL